MATKNFRVDFKSRNQDQKNFHKAFTFTLAKTPELAAKRIIDVRPYEEVQILNVQEVPR